MNNEPIYGTFHDVATNETVVRELTAEEVASLRESFTELEAPTTPE
jgi:hypothetical protein